jgi:hypothetical protein
LFRVDRLDDSVADLCELAHWLRAVSLAFDLQRSEEELLFSAVGPSDLGDEAQLTGDEVTFRLLVSMLAPAFGERVFLRGFDRELSSEKLGSSRSTAAAFASARQAAKSCRLAASFSPGRCQPSKSEVRPSMPGISAN